MSASATVPSRAAIVAGWCSLLRAAREPWPWLLALTMTFCGALAYRAPFTFNLDVGGSPPVIEGCYARDIYDKPFLDNFNKDAEFDVPHDQCTTAHVAYRWAFDDAHIRLPDIGRAPFDLSLRVAQGQREDQPVTSAWSINKAPLIALPIKRQPRTYHLLVPPPAPPTLDLHFQTPRFETPDDKRPLGFAVDRLHVIALAPTSPNWRQLVILSLAVVLSYALLRRGTVPERLAAAIGLLLVGLIAGLLVWQRINLTLVSTRLLVLLACGLGLSVVLVPLAAGLAKLCGIVAARREVRVIVGMVVLAWLIRTIGLFHPHAFSSDLGLNVHNLDDVITGRVLFTEGLPARAGGGRAPYPPAQYVMLAPFTLPELSSRSLITAGNALADSLAILWMWLLLRAVGLDQIAAFGAGTLYLFATPLLRSLSTGEMANVWGQALVLPWALVLVLWRQRCAGDVVLMIATVLVFLGHSGVFLSLLLLISALGLMWLARGERRVWRFALIVGAALALVVAGYYSAFVDELINRPGAPPATTSAIGRISFQLAQLVRPSGSIGPLLLALGLAGLILAWRRRTLLGQLLLAWWFSAIGSWAMLLVSQQALRWDVFLFPAIAAGGGVLLGTLWRSGVGLRTSASVAAGLAVVAGCALWVERIATYGH